MRIGTLRNLWSRVRRSVRDEPRDLDFVTEITLVQNRHLHE